MRNKNFSLILLVILLTTIAPSAFAVVIQCPSLEGTALTGDDAKNWKFKMRIENSKEPYDYTPPITLSPPTREDSIHAPHDVKSITFTFNQVQILRSSDTPGFSLICNGTYTMETNSLLSASPSTTSGTITGERFISNAEYKHCDPDNDGHSFTCELNK